MNKTLLLIVNPTAGKRRPKDFFLDVMSVFSQAGYYISLRQTEKRGDATRMAAQAQEDLVVCYGGDGTLNETVNGILSHPSPPAVGYLPGGSTNDFAASLHIPLDPVEAAKAIVASQGRRLDIGRFNDRHFMYVASFGAFTKASYSAPQNVKNDLGHFAYIIEGVKDLSSLRSYPVSIVADGETIEGRFLFGAIANATSIGGLMKLRPEQVVLDDGKFEMLLFPEPKNVADFNDMLRALLLQDYSGNGLIFRHVSQVTISSQEDLQWSLDGEYAPGGQQTEIWNLPRKLLMNL